MYPSRQGYIEGRRSERDSYGDPDVDDWLNTITNLLSSRVAKDVKAANVAILA